MSLLRRTFVLIAKDIVVHCQTSRSIVPMNLAHRISPLPYILSSRTTGDHIILQEVQSRRGQKDNTSTEKAFEACMRPSVRQSCPEPQTRSIDGRRCDLSICHRAMPIKRESLDLLVSTGHAARDRRARGRNIKPRLVDIV